MWNYMCIRWLINRSDSTKMHGATIRFKTLHVSDSSSVHHQEFFTVHTAMIYVTQVCWQLASRIKTELQFRPDPARKLSAKPLWHISLLCVQWKTPEEGQRNCPKHVEFYSKNKFEKLVHLVGFIIRTYKLVLCMIFPTYRRKMYTFRLFFFSFTTLCWLHCCVK